MSTSEVDPMAAATPAAPNGGRTRTLAVVVIAVTFLSGVIAGVVGDRFWLVGHRQLFPGRALHYAMPRILDRLDKELSLTPQQRESVKQILEKSHARIDAISSGVRPQIRQEIDQANAEIDKVLTPEQRKKFAELRMKVRRRHRGTD